MDTSKKRKKNRGQRVQDSSYMDTVRDAFVRWMALEKWREVEDLRSTLGYDLARAIGEAAKFPNRGRYRELWTAQWNAEVRPEAIGTEPGRLFGAIEKAMAAALRDEEAERKTSGDRDLDEEPEYKAFVDQGLEQLLRAGDLGTNS